VRAKLPAVDRRIAGVAFAFTALLFVLVVAPAGSPDPPDPAPLPPDLTAARALVAGLAAGERIDALVEYDIARTVPGVAGALETTVSEARFGDVRATRGPATLLVQSPDGDYNCERVDGEVSCMPTGAAASPPLSDAIAVAVASRGYDVTAAADAEIAGEPARCFTARAGTPADALPDLGNETELCLAADGLVLRARRTGDRATEEHVARRVVRASAGELRRLVLAGGFEAASSLLPR
jgi:hypothetical protein